MLTLLLPLMIAQAPEIPPPPVLPHAQAMLVATQDIFTLPEPLRPFIRYLWLHDDDPNDKARTWATLAGHVNALSRQPNVRSPAIVCVLNGRPVERRYPGIAPEEWATAVLIRVSLIDYAWDPAVYEELAFQSFWLHSVGTIEQTKEWKGGVWRVEDGGDGKTYPASTYKTTVKAAAPAGWLTPTENHRRALGALVEQTRSYVPILRADNFFWQTCRVVNRRVGYYRMLGITSRADFERITGVDRKAAAAFTQELLAVVSDSKVAVAKTRRVVRIEKIGGGAWFTQDNRRAIDLKNPMRVLNGGFQHEAEEWFSGLPNRFWATGAFAADGKVQDVVPANIAGNHMSHDNDLEIHPYIDCYRCHREGGLRPFKCWARAVITWPLELKPIAPDGLTVEKVAILNEKYSQPLEPLLDEDRLRYARALKLANGLTPEQHADNLHWLISKYERSADLARASVDLGVTPEVWRARLDHYAKIVGHTDTVLSIFLKDPKEQLPIPIDQWHEAYPLAQLALHGYVLPTPVLERGKR